MPGCGIRFQTILSMTTFNNPEQVRESNVRFRVESPTCWGVFATGPNKFGSPMCDSGVGVPNLLGVFATGVNKFGSPMCDSGWSPQLVGGVRHRPERVRESDVRRSMKLGDYEEAR
jgi:hypothetical protein